VTATGSDLPLHRRRPGAEAIRAATDAPAVDLGDGIWMSPGLSNSYLLTTSAGRIVINTGMGFEAPLHRAAFDEVDRSPTRYVVLTQGHYDHVGGVDRFLEPGTDVVAQAAFDTWRADNERLEAFRVANAAFAWMHAILAALEHAQHRDGGVPAQSRPEPTVVFEDHLVLEEGGRRMELLSVPGGETTDSLVVWLPEERIAFTGNLLGPLFGHVPNLVTMRGDRYRDALDYVASVQRVIDLRPRRLVTGHFDPIEGADVIAAELTRLRDATRWIHDRTVEGMNEGRDVHDLMASVRLPDELAVGEGYGKVSWNVRAIWENYAGWFHHRSTTELYPTPASAVAPDVVAAAGADALVEAARRRIDAGEPAAALHLTDLVLATEPGHRSACDAAAEAHERLLERSENFWESAWLRREIERLRAEVP
jgi:alkyl sulfatase BDS1-like metallo-beta-lactamase superfamily hydrolase